MIPKVTLIALFALVLIGISGVSLAQGTPGNALQHWLGADLFALVRASDPLGKASLVLLAIFSITSWMVIVYKYLHLRQATRQTDAFVDVCNQGNGQLEEAFRYAANFPDSPLAQILREGYLELEIEGWYREGYPLEPETRLELAKVGVERVLERTISNEITHLESKLIFLATTTNVCPFIGLLGTVWGIIIAFQGLVSSGSAALSALLPGLSTALLCTMGGLLCAIPSSVMYNYLTHKAQLLISRMDSFSLELSNVIQKQLIKK